MEDTDRRLALEQRVRELEGEGFKTFTRSAFDAKLYKDHQRSPLKCLQTLWFLLLVLGFLLQPRPLHRRRMGPKLARVGEGVRAHTLMVELSVDEQGKLREKRLFFSGSLFDNRGL